MSVNYASGLSPYEHKGKCGMKEIFDAPEIFDRAIEQLVQMVRESKNMVVITGAGISTSAGIPDFRGPRGVWTLEERGETPKVDVTFETAKPTLTHMALVALEKKNILKHLISQNVDGLHLRSGFPIHKLSELHGNMFLEQCDLCKTTYIRSQVVPTMARKVTGSKCKVKKQKGVCRGRLRDTILDWEDELQIYELNKSEDFCKNSDLCLCLGTSLQIMPCGNMPLLVKKNGGKIVVVNLQKTRMDNKCDLKIHAYIDHVMEKLCEGLKIDIPLWSGISINLKYTSGLDDKPSLSSPLLHDSSSNNINNKGKDYNENADKNNINNSGNNINNNNNNNNNNEKKSNKSTKKFDDYVPRYMVDECLTCLRDSISDDNDVPSNSNVANNNNNNNIINNNLDNDNNDTVCGISQTKKFKKDYE